MADKDDVSHNAERWAKLKEMRERRDGAPPAPIKVDDPSHVTQVRNADGAFATPNADAEAAAAAAADKDAAEKAQADEAAALAAEKAAAVAAAAEALKKSPTAPNTEEIELDIDGVKTKVALDPSLAEAFKKAEKVKADAAVAAEANKNVVDREKMKAELREELRAELTPKKSDADRAAEAALAEAERLAKAPKKPPQDLLVSDPAKWQEQQEEYEEWRINEAAEKMRRETLAEVNKNQQVAAATAEKQGRLILREQFYNAYPALKPSATLVDIMLEKQIDAVVASGKIAKPLSPPEREALRAETFAAVAADATKELAKLIGAARQVVTPPPPTLVASAPEKKPLPKKEEPKAERLKEPKGSVSAILRAHQASKEKKSA